MALVVPYATFSKDTQQINFTYPLTVSNNITNTGNFTCSNTLNCSNLNVSTSITTDTINTQSLNLTNNLQVSKLGIGATVNTNYDLTTNLIFANSGNLTTQNKVISLYDTTNNAHQFMGLGVNSSALRYQVDDTGSSHIFYAGTGVSTSSELMRIQGNGNVGIGTATATQKLHVEGEILSKNRITISDVSTPILRFDRSGGINIDWELYTNPNGFLTWRGGANGSGVTLTDFMCLNDIGYIGIGTNNPLYPVSVGSSGAGIPNHSGQAPMWSARAWVVFNGATGAVAQSQNISSVSRIATGDYQLNFTINQSTGTYVAQATSSITAGNVLTNIVCFTSPFAVSAPGVGSCRFTATNLSGAVADPRYVCITIFST